MNEINQNIFEKQTDKKHDVNFILAIGLVIVSYIVIAVAYYIFCYISFPALTIDQSIVLYALSIIVIAIFVGISPYSTRPIDFIFTELLVLELITFIKYAAYFGTDMIIAGAIAVFVAVLTLAFAVKRNKHFKRNKASNTIRLMKYFKNALVLLCLPLIVAVGMARCNSYAFYENRELNTSAITQECNILQRDQNYKSQLWDWDFKEPEDRLSALCSIEQDLCQDLGISTVPVSAAIIGLDIAGEYEPESNVIKLDYAWLKKCSVDDAVNCIAHETYHIYQQRLIELFNKLTKEEKTLKLISDSNAEAYAANAENYLGANMTNYNLYQAQALEADARAFAKEQMVIILEGANIHLSEDIIKQYE